MLLISDNGNMNMFNKIGISLFIFIFSMMLKNITLLMILTYNKFDGRNNTSSIRRFKKFMKMMKTISIIFFIISFLIGVISILSLLLDSNEKTQDVIVIWMALPIWFSLREGINKAMNRL